jgi:uncharacterized membrane protein (DUF2068 family)
MGVIKKLDPAEPARRLRRMRSPWRDFDWNLRACGRHGHVTWAPDEPGLASRLRVETVEGEAWRCLRCATYVPGPPRGSGPANAAPIVLRGRALRDAFILRLLALERAVRGVLLVALAYGVYRFEGAQDSLQRLFDDYLPRLTPVAAHAGIDLQSAGPVRLIQKALATNTHTLTLVSLGVLAYGALELLEAVGLWLMRRWGEYVAVVGTAVFVPLEVYEMVERVTWLRVAAFAVNVFAVVYLVWTKRLFGTRGGHAAFEAQRHSESLLEVEQAAADEVG